MEFIEVFFTNNTKIDGYPQITFKSVSLTHESLSFNL